jgi:hypothetical protein
LGEKKLKNSINVKKTAAIFAILLMTFSAFMIALPAVNAATPLTEPTRIFINLQPDPVGVGQETAIGVWIYPIPLTANMRYDNITVVMTKPDGTKQTFGPVDGGPLGNWVWLYTPSAAGNYTFVASWPGHTYYNLTYTAALGGLQAPLVDLTRSGDTSQPVTLTVQDEPVERMSDTPLPTEYWTYPINAQNYLWAGAMGQADYTSGPKTAHVLWTQQYCFGGIEGAPFDAVSYASGTMYETKRSPNIIINGRYYQYGSVQGGGAGDRIVASERLLYCYDIATGKVLWSKNMTVTFAQIYEYNSANQVGLHAYLWNVVGSTWEMYDAYDGDYIMTFYNATGGNRFTEDQTFAGAVPYHGNGCYRGNLLQYIVNNRAGWVALWNFTKMCDSTVVAGRAANGVITYQATSEKDQYGVYGGQWRPSNTTVTKKDWMSGIEWNKTFTPDPTVIPAFTSFSGIDYKNQIGIYQSSEGNDKKVFWGYSINPSNPGRIWGPVNVTATYTTGFSVGNDYFITPDPLTMRYFAYDTKTGNFAWQSDAATFPWGSLIDIGQRISFDQKQLYAISYDGLHIYDMATGKEQFFVSSGDSGLETPYGTWVGRFASLRPDGDHKVYYSTGAWHPMPAYERGDRLFCVDAITGQVVWNFTGFWGTPSPIANGYLVGFNEYDQTVYCFNKGPTATTVSAPTTAVPVGSSVLVQGTVLDQSPGKANGYAAISDAWMTPWMEYIFQQQPRPANAIGVPVSIDAYDPNGNLIHLGDTTSDTAGVYTLVVDPSKLEAGAGQYRIVATFAGSEGYFKSSAETGLLMGAAATPVPTASPVSFDAINNSVMTYTLAAAIAIIIAIALVGLMILRKKA